ncbi:MAG: exo-alpha-sialidase [Proteobacteria bacterium]|nr:exo-alpha-sialidase [Pseudomonadota bacterium]
MNHRTFGLLRLFAAAIPSMLIFGNQPLHAAETSVATLAGSTHFHGIAVDAGDTSRLYLATHHGVYAVALDGSADRISANRNDYMGFTPHPTDPNVLFGSGHPTGGGNMGFITSTNRGKTWKKLSDGVDGPVDFHQMDVSKADPSIIVGMSGGLQMSRDGGHSWTKIGPGPAGLIDLAASAKDINTFYAATQRGLAKSTDGGKSWKPAHLVSRTATMVHVTSDATVYAYQIGTGLIKTSEPKLVWPVVNNNFGQSYIAHLAVDPANTKLLYAITGNQQTRAQSILSSLDGGKTWKNLGEK